MNYDSNILTIMIHFCLAFCNIDLVEPVVPLHRSFYCWSALTSMMNQHSQLDIVIAMGLQIQYLRTGLRYEDIMSRDEPEVNEALELADPDVVEGRYRRLKRASDLAFKQKNLEDYAPNIVLEPFKREISADVEKILNRDLEFDLLNNHKSG